MTSAHSKDLHHSRPACATGAAQVHTPVTLVATRTAAALLLVSFFSSTGHGAPSKEHPRCPAIETSRHTLPLPVPCRPTERSEAPVSRSLSPTHNLPYAHCQLLPLFSEMDEEQPSSQPFRCRRAPTFCVSFSHHPHSAGLCRRLLIDADTCRPSSK